MTDTEWRAERNSPDDWDVYDGTGRIVACELSETQAKLIAAAPDMLAALKFLAEDNDPAGKIARAALKKATP